MGWVIRNLLHAINIFYMISCLHFPFQVRIPNRSLSLGEGSWKDILHHQRVSWNIPKVLLMSVLKSIQLIVFVFEVGISGWYTWPPLLKWINYNHLIPSMPAPGHSTNLRSISLFKTILILLKRTVWDKSIYPFPNFNCRCQIYISRLNTGGNM